MLEDKGDDVGEADICGDKKKEEDSKYDSLFESFFIKTQRRCHSKRLLNIKSFHNKN